MLSKSFRASAQAPARLQAAMSELYVICRGHRHRGQRRAQQRPKNTCGYHTKGKHALSPALYHTLTAKGGLAGCKEPTRSGWIPASCICWKSDQARSRGTPPLVQASMAALKVMRLGRHPSSFITSNSARASSARPARPATAPARGRNQ